MTPQYHLDAIARDSARFASVAAGALGTESTILGGWSVRDLVAHLGAVYSMVIANVQAASNEPTAPGEESHAPEGDAITEWFAERRTSLLAALSAAADDDVAWTFVGVKTAAWWKRRMAHETSVHRWDLEASIGDVDAVEPIDGDLAADGVDEYIEVSLRYSSSRPNRIYPTESLHLHRSDGPGEWMLVGDGQGGLTATHEHGKGDAAVRGPASSLLLWFWGRPVTDVEIFGDESVATTWQSLAP